MDAIRPRRDASRVWTMGDQTRALTLQAKLKALEERGLPLPPNDLLELNYLASKYEATGNQGEMRMPQRKPDLDLYAFTVRVPCRTCGAIHRVPVLYERQHMASLAVAAGEPKLAFDSAIKTIQIACPAIDERLESTPLTTDYNLLVPYDTVYVAHGTARL